MKIKIQVEGKKDITPIADIFEALETNKINLTTTKKLEEISEVRNIKQQIAKEVEDTLGDKIHVEELIIFKSGTYILKGILQK